VASKTSSTRKTPRAKAARSFDVLLPRLNRAGEGETFAPGNFVRRSGVIPAQLQAVRLNGSPVGIHAAGEGDPSSLCGVSLTPNGKGSLQVHASGQAAKVAPSVTCKFCATRLVGAGVLDPKAEGVSPYAADYGTRDAEAELKAIEEQESKSKKGTVKAAA
jgi:hypothetical protein